MFLDNKLDASAIPTQSTLNNGTDEDKTSTRSLATSYQNTSGRPLQVRVIAAATTGATGTDSSLQLWSGPASGDPVGGNAAFQRTLVEVAATFAITIGGMMQHTVPVNHYYAVRNVSSGVGSAASVTKWYEQAL